MFFFSILLGTMLYFISRGSQSHSRIKSFSSWFQSFLVFLISPVAPNEMYREYPGEPPSNVSITLFDSFPLSFYECMVSTIPVGSITRMPRESPRHFCTRFSNEFNWHNRGLLPAWQPQPMVPQRYFFKLFYKEKSFMRASDTHIFISWCWIRVRLCLE